MDNDRREVLYLLRNALPALDLHYRSLAFEVRAYLNKSDSPPAVSSEVEFTAKLDQLLGQWSTAAQGGITSHEIIRDQIVAHVRKGFGNVE